MGLHKRKRLDADFGWRNHTCSFYDIWVWLSKQNNSIKTFLKISDCRDYDGSITLRGERYFLTHVFLFSFAIFFGGKLFISVVGDFFIFMKLPFTRRVQVCRFGVLYNTSIGCHRAPEAGGGGAKSRYRPYFKQSFRYTFTRFYFVTTKIGGFWENFRVFTVDWFF